MKGDKDEKEEEEDEEEGEEGEKEDLRVNNWTCDEQQANESE